VGNAKRSSIHQLTAAAEGFFAGSVPVDEAQALIAQWIKPVAAIEKAALRECLGRVLGESVRSTVNVPPHDNSAMDGWAVRYPDLNPEGSTQLKIESGASWAGRPWKGASVKPGHAVRVFTGALIPVGSDTVVAQEQTQIDPSTDQLTILPGQRAGQHRRLSGDDLAVGQIALAAGTLIGPAELGLAASLGLSELPVRRRLRVVLFSTGDELRSIGETLGSGEIYDSNRHALWAMLRRLEFDIQDLGIVRDDPVTLGEAIQGAALGADAIVSSGGVSVGEADFAREVLNKVGDVAFWTLAIRPGRPLAIGQIGSAAYFGLPGNPVAALVTFLFVVRDALLQLAGANPKALVTVPVRCAHALRKGTGRTEYHRAIVRRSIEGHLDEGHPNKGHLEAVSAGPQGSGQLRTMVEANAILILPADRGYIAEGDSVEALLFDGLL